MVFIIPWLTFAFQTSILCEESSRFSRFMFMLLLLILYYKLNLEGFYVQFGTMDDDMEIYS